MSEHFFFSYHDDQNTIDERKFQIHIDLLYIQNEQIKHVKFKNAHTYSFSVNTV